MHAGRAVQIIAARQGGGTSRDISFQHVSKALRRRRWEDAAGFHLRRVLREARAARGSDVYDSGRVSHAGERCADKRVQSLENVVRAKNAASESEMMHVNWNRAVSICQSIVPR